MQIIISGAKGVDRILIVTPLIAAYLEKYLGGYFQETAINVQMNRIDLASLGWPPYLWREDLQVIYYPF
jgi:hypothetical protein